MRTFPRTLPWLIYFWSSPHFLKLQQNFKSTVMVLFSSFCVGDVHKVRTQLGGICCMKLI